MENARRVPCLSDGLWFVSRCCPRISVCTCKAEGNLAKSEVPVVKTIDPINLRFPKMLGVYGLTGVKLGCVDMKVEVFIENKTTRYS